MGTQKERNKTGRTKRLVLNESKTALMIDRTPQQYGRMTRLDVRNPSA